MDLRKSVLLTKVQQTSSNLSEKSLNNSILSAYDTADESDNSLYFSFSESTKSRDSLSSNLSNVTTTSTDMDDKENTTIIENVVMMSKMTSASKIPVREPPQVSQLLSDVSAPPGLMEDSSIMEITTDNQMENLHDFSIEEVRVLKIKSTVDDSEPEPATTEPEQQPIIVIDDESLTESSEADPNANLVNPFIIIPDSPTPAVRKSIRRSSIVVSTQAHYFSPVIRRSIDKLAVNYIKPVAARRTIFTAAAVKPSELKPPMARPRTVGSSENPKPTTSKESTVTVTKKIAAVAPVRKTTTIIAAAKIPPKVRPATTTTVAIKPPVNLRRSVIPTAKPVTKTITASKSVQPVIKPTTQSKLPDEAATSSTGVVRPSKRKSSPRKPSPSTARSSSDSIPYKVPKLSQLTVQPCKYCGKKFKESAFVNHWADNCTVIPLPEKKKIIAQREKTEVLGKRRTTIFLAPPPTFGKCKRPQPVMNKSLNKSGIRITPKKSLKCHICAAIIEDAFSLAKHVLEHKFRRENEQKMEEEK